MAGREREITKSKFRTGIMASVLSVLMSVMIALPVYGGQWMYDNTGWRWQDENGNQPENRWLWLGGNQDGLAEHYYFGPDGYMISNTTAPDGQQVNEDGAWIIDGIVQREEMNEADNRVWNINMSEAEYVRFMDMANRINGKTGVSNKNVLENRAVLSDSAEGIFAEGISTEDISGSRLAYHIIQLVNEERQRNGKTVLAVDVKLMENAVTRAEEACTYYSHTRPDKSKFDTAITVKRYSSAENLARLYRRESLETAAEAAVKGWRDSEKHRKQMLDERWTRTGAGVCERDGYIFISQIFIKGI